MKRLIFDDFQPHRNEGFSTEEKEAGEISIPERLSHADSNQSAENRDYSFTSTTRVEEPKVREFNKSDFFDVDSEIYKTETEPRTEFDFLLNKVLGVIKEVLFAHTVAFFWANREKNQMIMEAHVSDSVNFFSSRRFPIGHDLVSKVAQTGKPEFVSEINQLSESELFCYYSSPLSVKSFVGVPVFFSRGSIEEALQLPIAVLVVDSKAEDEFGTETLALLGRFTKLISILIKSYNDKYDLLVDAELMSSIRHLQERIRNNFSLNIIVQALAEEASRMINWNFLTIILYDEAKHAWVAKKVTNRAHEGYIVTEQAIDFPESVVGHTIKNNIHTLVDDLESSHYPRYYTEEKVEKKGSFASVPITSLNKCYGAINVESRERFNFSRRDIEMLYRLAENAASALEIFYMKEIIHEYVIIDDVTGMYSKKFLLQRMEEELHRADDAGNELSLLFITVDKADEITQRYGIDGFERVMLTLAKAIRSSVRQYDLVGRYDTDRFGVLLIGTASNEAYLWAEKIRKTIAALIINLDGKSFSITISIGVSGVLEGMKKEELIGNTIAVLNTASQAGGNVVRVF
ncbi:MAG: diguanylate cyclase [Ignavibacteriales bacterium]|nr:diguanylate cyclase [Ignavibacteriales bacterium]